MGRVLAKFSPIVAAQLTLAMTALLLVAFAPPAQGRMLLVSIHGEPIPPAMVESHHATPLKPGPIEGSWIVEGQRSALAGLFSSEGIIVLAAPEALCGGPAANGEYQA
jgi:hypothetical protein